MDNRQIHQVFTWLDRTSFLSIFLVWSGLVILCSLIFHFATTPNTYLLFAHSQEQVVTLIDAIYFSFITATSTGFGDIIPFGFFRVLSVIEVVTGLILFAVLTSKLISFKQNIILNEIYEHSLHDKTNQIRTSLVIFRQNMNRTIRSIEKKQITKREIKDSYLHFSTLEETLKGLQYLLKRAAKAETLTIEPLSIEIISLSIVNSYSKILDLHETCTKLKISLPEELTKKSLPRILDITEDIFAKVNKRKDLTPVSKKDIHLSQASVISKIKKTYQI